MRFPGYLNWLLMTPLALMLVVVLYGSLELMAQAFVRPDGWGFGNFPAFFARADYVRAFFATHMIAAIVTAISLVIAWPTAHTMARHPASRSWLVPLILTPLLTSLVVRTFGWMVVLGPNGLVNDALLALGIVNEPARLLFNMSGIVIGLVHVFFPFAVFSIYNALTRIDPDLPEAAMALGSGPVRTLFKVTLPLASTGIINGASIVYLLSTGAIVTPLLLGGPGNQMLGTLVYVTIFSYFDFPRAATVAIVLTVSALAVVALLTLADRFLNRHMSVAR